MANYEGNYSPDAQMRSEHTERETDRKCPNCGATVIFDPTAGGMYCEYCGYRQKLPNTDTYNQIRELDFASAAVTESYEWGSEKKSVECKQCGAVTIYDALETAAVCPFCGSTHVMPAATERTIAPGGICPFQITKETAGQRFTLWLNRKLFAPREAKRSASPEAFKGVYLPYWTYDAQTTSNFTAKAGWDDDDDDGKSSTRWKSVGGIYNEFIDDEAVMASKRHESSGVKECEPFDFSRLVPYNPQYLAGFVAERYSIGLQDGWGIAQTSIQKKLKRSIEENVKQHWKCDRVHNTKFTTVYNNITYKYVLVPSWISSFKYKDKVYQFAVNGQTGKVGGKAPVSVIRVILAILIVVGLCWAIQYFFG